MLSNELKGRYEKILHERHRKTLYRKLPDKAPIKDKISFCSNDYLGLKNEKRIIEKSIQWTKKWGVGSGSARLLIKEHIQHNVIEKQLETLFSPRKALLFNTGFQLNSSIIPCLIPHNGIIFADKHCHNSIWQGILLSRAKYYRYYHNNMEHLEQLLKKYASNNHPMMIISESLFSMDGDRCDINYLCKMAKTYNALLYLDDAHAIGILGKKGLGLSSSIKDVDISIGTFGKALGSFGAYVLCSPTLYEYIINTCNGFIYTTALPPSILGAMSAVLEWLPELDERRQKVANLSTEIHQYFKTLNNNNPYAKDHIIPMIIKDSQKTLDIVNQLYHKNIECVAIRPPTVPKDKAMIRFSICSHHTSDNIKHLINSIDELRQTF